MAENPKTPTGAEPSFEEFLRTAPTPEAQDTVTLIGVVTRSEKEGNFYLSTGGQVIELPSNAVRKYRVVQESAPERVVELDVDPSKLPQPEGLKRINTAPNIDAIFTKKELIKEPVFDTRKEVLKDPLVDTYKELIKDPIQDPITLYEQVNPDPFGGINPVAGGVVNPAAGAAGMGGAPFVMATPHHASAAAVGMQAGAGAGATVAKSPLSDVATLPSVDLHTTTVLADFHTNWYNDHIHTHKELVKDPILDPITVFEQVTPDPYGNINPVAGGVNPVAGAAGMGGAPFVMATPHHASAAAVGMQAGAGAGATVAKPPLSDVATLPSVDLHTTTVLADFHTNWWLDHHHTLKELIKDPILDPITIFEQIDPGLGNPVDPVAVGAAQAQAQAQAMSAQPAAGAAITSPLADYHTHFWFDRPTFKELAKDPLKDTHKDPLIDPLAQQIPGPIWNLPGMMF